MTIKIRKLEVYSIDHEDMSLRSTINLMQHDRYLHLIIPEDSAVEVETEWHDEHPFNYNNRSALAYRKLFDEMRGVKEDNSDLMAQRDRLLKSGSPEELVEFAMQFNPRGHAQDRFHPSFCRVPALMFALFSILCCRRDKERASFSEDSVVALLKLDRLLDVERGAVFASTPDGVRKTVKLYLASIPDFSFTAGEKQSSIVAENCLGGDMMVVAETMTRMKLGARAW